MNNRSLTFKLILIVLTAVGFASQSANAKSIASFDERMAAIIESAKQHDINSQNQVWRQYLQRSFPRLHAEYRQYLASGQRGMTFEQYVERDLKSAADTKIQRALNAQSAGWQQ